MTCTASNTIIKELSIDGSYLDFNDFYSKNNEIIYRTIIELFGKLKSKKYQYATILITTKIKDLNWDTDLTFSLAQSFLLKRDILPFFEEIEDYETCVKIQSLDNQIKPSKRYNRLTLGSRCCR